MSTWDVCLPSRGLSPYEAMDLAARAEELGYGGVWASEVAGHDSIALLAVMATRTSRLRLGTAVVPAGTRSPAVLAMGAATLAQLAPGRVVIGTGVSSRSIVEEWHGREFGRPLSAVGDTLEIMRQALAGGTTDYEGKGQHSRGFRLQKPPDLPPALFLAALGPSMRKLAAERFDGMILNFLPRSRIGQVLVQTPPTGTFEVTSLVRVSIDQESEAGERRLRKELASYLRVDQYRRWLDSLQLPLADAAPTDPVAAIAARIPNVVLTDIAIMGDPASCREQLQQMCDAGVTPIVMPDAEVGDTASILRTVKAVAPLPNASDAASAKGQE